MLRLPPRPRAWNLSEPGGDMVVGGPQERLNSSGRQSPGQIQEGMTWLEGLTLFCSPGLFVTPG